MKKKLPFIIIFTALITLIVIYYLKYSQFYASIYTANSKNTTPISKEKNTYTILLLGYGGGTHAGTYLTDTIMIINLNTKNKTSTIISIPRDLWVKIPTNSHNGFHAKINSVYQMGLSKKNYPNLPSKYYGNQGAANLIKLIAGYITGIPIDYYIAIDFKGFVKAIDILGGIDVQVEKSFTDNKYPIEGKEEDLCGLEGEELENAYKISTESPEIAFPCRYETLSFQSGLQHMDGEKALKFVRSRYSSNDGGDFARAKRQHLFLEAVRKKILTIGFVPKIIPLMEELSNHIKTDIPSKVMQQMLFEAKENSNYKINHIIISTSNYLKESLSTDKQYILIPKEGIDKWGRLQKEIRSMIF